MGKQKDWLIDWLEDVGYEMGYDLRNYHEVDKETVLDYLREHYRHVNEVKQKEMFKMQRDSKIRAIVREEIIKHYNMEQTHSDSYRKDAEFQGLIEHLASYETD